MTEISIIINGVRYDAVEQLAGGCNNCDLIPLCKGYKLFDLCLYEGELFIFKKSYKKFEK